MWMINLKIQLQYHLYNMYIQDNRIIHKKSFFIYLNSSQLQGWFIFKIINKSEKFWHFSLVKIAIKIASKILFKKAPETTKEFVLNANSKPTKYNTT